MIGGKIVKKIARKAKKALHRHKAKIAAAGAGVAAGVGAGLRTGTSGISGGETDPTAAIAAASTRAIMGHRGGGGRGGRLHPLLGGPMGRRYRRINPGNTKAMRRAVRRIHAGAKLYSQFFQMQHGRMKHAPHVKLRRHRRRAA